MTNPHLLILTRRPRGGAADPAGDLELPVDAEGARTIDPYDQQECRAPGRLSVSDITSSSAAVRYGAELRSNSSRNPNFSTAISVSERSTAPSGGFIEPEDRSGRQRFCDGPSPKAATFADNVTVT